MTEVYSMKPFRQCTRFDEEQMLIFDEETIMRNHIRSQRAEAAMQNAVEMCQEFNLSFPDSVQKLVDKFGLSENEAEETVQKYWQ